MKSRRFAKSDLVVLLALGGLAALVFGLSTASFAYPGESAHLQVVWRGLDTAAQPQYPLMAVFARLLGCGNLIAPVCGVLSVLLVYLITSVYVRSRVAGGLDEGEGFALGRVAGLSTAVVFMLTPAVASAATHLEPRLFDACWLLLATFLFVPYLLLPRKVALAVPVLMGVVAALGFCDSVVFAVFAPFALVVFALLDMRSERAPYAALGLFTLSFIVAFFVARAQFGLEFGLFVRTSWKELASTWRISGWALTALFATIPFFVALFSGGRSFAREPGLSQWIFHGVLSVLVILAFASPWSPSSLMKSIGVTPVLSCLFAAATSGYLFAFWWFSRRHPVGKAGGIVFLFAVTLTCFLNALNFDRRDGSFADAFAEKILEDMGDRTWIVTDGRLDDHLRLCAAKAGRELNIVSLARDIDPQYRETLSRTVREKGLGGSRNQDLVNSASLGVLTFVQDWFASDPSVIHEAVVFGVPDIWYVARYTPVPEVLFFGADEKREPHDGDLDRYVELLGLPKDWGSFPKGVREYNPVARLRQDLRRHLGRVANNRGVYLQEHERKDEAFAQYERVLGQIDRDNICALFNEYFMARAGHPKALAKGRDLENKVKAVLSDKDRNYVRHVLSRCYGYIHNDPRVLSTLGKDWIDWLKSGLPGDGVVRLRRAMDFLPADDRQSFQSLMADFYANEREVVKSRAIYAEALEKNAQDHNALIGMMRLELIEGDTRKALEYLEKAAAVSKAESLHAKKEYAMIAAIKNDWPRAAELLKSVTKEDPKDLHAWSLYVSVLLQRCEATRDNGVRAQLLKEVSETVIPVMEKNADRPDNGYVLVAKAQLLLSQGETKRRQARDAFAKAMLSRSTAEPARNMVLKLDMALDDKENAEAHARSVLRMDREAPLANYVMGSISLGKGEYAAAEAYLRKAVKGKNPNVLALNDIAEVLRRLKKFDEAEQYARLGVKTAPKFYILWQTLGDILLDAGGDLDEAERCLNESLKLSKADGKSAADVRIFISLTRIGVRRGDKKGAQQNLRKVEARIGELSAFERKEFEEIKKSVR